jgi:hypothetical protein
LFWRQVLVSLGLSKVRFSLSKLSSAPKC